MQISPVMMSSNMMKRDISANLYQKCLILCSKIPLSVLDSINSFVTVATYLVPDRPNIRGISAHLWRSILIFANGVSYAWSSKHKSVCLSLWPHLMFCKLKITNIEIKWMGTGKEWIAMAKEFSTAVGVFSVELSAYQVSMVCAAN